MAIAVMPPEMQKLNQGVSVRTQISNCFRATCLIIVVGTPSWLYLIAYLTLYLIAVLGISLLQGDLADPIFIETLKIQPGNIAAIILIMFMLQGRELRRFNDQINILNANSQVKTIFNMSSDAIIVVKKKLPLVEDTEETRQLPVL